MTEQPAVWSDTDPLMTAIAAAVYEQCASHPERSLTVDDPRNIAAVAATVARQVLGTTTETDTTPAAAEQKPEDHPGAELFAQLRRAGLDPDTAHKRIYAYAAMVLRQDKAIAPEPAPADRAAGLREAVEVAVRAARACGDSETGQYAASIAAGIGRELRRMADEAQQPTPTEAEAHPAEHTGAAELHDPLATEWIPSRRYVTRDRAVADLQHGRAIGPTWKDGTPTQRRLVRGDDHVHRRAHPRLDRGRARGGLPRAPQPPRAALPGTRRAVARTRPRHVRRPARRRDLHIRAAVQPDVRPRRPDHPRLDRGAGRGHVVLSAILHRLRNHHRSDRARRRRPVCRCGRAHPGPRDETPAAPPPSAPSPNAQPPDRPDSPAKPRPAATSPTTRT